MPVNVFALNRLRAWMQAKGLAQLFVQQPENFSWLTAGDNTVVAFRPVAAWLEVTPDTVRLHSSQIEANRLLEEEALGIETVRYPWYAPPMPEGPNDTQHDLTALRLVLSQPEQELLRQLGRDTAHALGECIRFADPDWTEFDLAGAIAEGLWSKGIQPLVLLTAGEERIFRYRHPLPKHHPLGQLFMGVVCGRRNGLIASVSRLGSFGHPQAQALNHTVCKIEAAMLNHSQAGTSLGEIMDVTRAAYNTVGQGSEFENHHQGGITGYRSREIVARPGNPTQLEVGMALAWNPTLPGAKVEDTFLLGENGLENLTHDPSWPTLLLEGRQRPMVFEG